MHSNSVCSQCWLPIPFFAIAPPRQYATKSSTHSGCPSFSIAPRGGGGIILSVRHYHASAMHVLCKCTPPSASVALRATHAIFAHATPIGGLNGAGCLVRGVLGGQGGPRLCHGVAPPPSKLRVLKNSRVLQVMCQVGLHTSPSSNRRHQGYRIQPAAERKFL